MLGIFSALRIGATATVTALSAVPNMAMSPSLAILRASSVPTVGSPWSSYSVSWIFRPSTPPAAFAWLAARLTPRHSNWPRSLFDPLWASTTAILIGPAAVPLDAPPPDDGLLLAPGALHAAAVRTSAATATAPPTMYL